MFSDSASSPKKSGAVQWIVTFIGATTPHSDPRLIGDHDDFASIESLIRTWTSVDMFALFKVGFEFTVIMASQGESNLPVGQSVVHGENQVIASTSAPAVPQTTYISGPSSYPASVASSSIAASSISNPTLEVDTQASFLYEKKKNSLT